MGRTGRCALGIPGVSGGFFWVLASFSWTVEGGKWGNRGEVLINTEWQCPSSVCGLYWSTQGFSFASRIMVLHTARPCALLRRGAVELCRKRGRNRRKGADCGVCESGAGSWRKRRCSRAS